jgi:hypothetical protein
VNHTINNILPNTLAGYRSGQSEYKEQGQMSAVLSIMVGIVVKAKGIFGFL